MKYWRIIILWIHRRRDVIALNFHDWQMRSDASRLLEIVPRFVASSVMVVFWGPGRSGNS